MNLAPIIDSIAALNESSKLLYSIMLTLATVSIVAICYHLLKKKIFQDIANKNFKRWLGIIFIAAKSPAAVLISCYVLYLGLIPFFPLFSSTGKTATVDNYFTSLLLLAKFIIGFWFIFRLVKLINGELIKFANKAETKSGTIFAEFLSRNLKYIVTLISISIVLPLLPLESELHTLLANSFQLFFIGIIAWLAIELISAFEKSILNRYQIAVEDNFLARKVYTQIKVFKKIAIIFITILTVAAALMTFEGVRQYGASLLASAGVLTAIAGIAAQRSLSGVFAGLQIAISQPIRIDDAVIVENEFGFIEEINLTYAVIRLWDWRRMIVPINYFIEKPFQNWTRNSTNLIGVIFIYVDYTLPVDEIRNALNDILKASKLWDGKVSVVHVSDAKPEVMELRILASATNAPNTWDLRCEVREKLIAYIQQHYPQSLPKVRTDYRVVTDDEIQTE